jgi:uncharacterized protein involved in exopolysaccharide biosynthesis
VAALITLLGAAGGLVGSQVIPATYAARAEVLYPITEEQPTGFLREDRNLTTQLVLMRSRAVLGPAAASAGVELAPVNKPTLCTRAGPSNRLMSATKARLSGILDF